MLTPAIAASSGSAPFVSISYARATPRMPFADAMTVGREARHTGASSLASRLPARPRESPAAAAAPVPRKPRRDTEDIGSPMKVTPESVAPGTGRLPTGRDQESGVRGQGRKGA